MGIATLAPEAAFFVLGIFELLEEVFLLLGKLGRGVYDDRDDVSAAVAVTAHDHAVAGEPKWGARLGAGGDAHGDGAVDGLYVYLATEGGVDHVDMLLGEDEVAFAGEVLVGLYADANIEVAWLAAAVCGGGTFAADADGHAVVDAGWDLDLHIFAGGVVYFYGGAKNGISKIYGSTSLDVGTLPGATWAAKTEKIAKDVV